MSLVVSCLAFALLLTIVCPFAFSAEAKPPAGDVPLDADLLKQLGGGATKPVEPRDVEPAEPAEGDAPAKRKVRSTAEIKDFFDRLKRELGDAADEEHPLASIAGRMSDSQQRLGKLDAGEDTQKLQAQIAAELTKLIRQVRMSSRTAPGNPSDQQPSARGQLAQPGDRSPKGGNPNERTSANASRGGDKPADLRDPQEPLGEVMKRVWGDLPERAREQLLQLPAEEFVPKYEQLITEYYRRLAAEKAKPR